MSKPNTYQLKLQQEIIKKASFMSTTKWETLFSIVKEINPKCVANIKLLLADNTKEITIPSIEDIINKKYIEEYWGVFELKEIEWLFIPSEIKIERKNRDEPLIPKIQTQNTKQIAKTLQKGTQFEYEQSMEGIKIYGYK